jgi:hypothetical protein
LTMLLPAYSGPPPCPALNPWASPCDCLPLAFMPSTAAPFSPPGTGAALPEVFPYRKIFAGFSLALLCKRKPSLLKSGPRQNGGRIVRGYEMRAATFQGQAGIKTLTLSGRRQQADSGCTASIVGTTAQWAPRHNGKGGSQEPGVWPIWTRPLSWQRSGGRILVHGGRSTHRIGSTNSRGEGRNDIGCKSTMGCALVGKEAKGNGVVVILCLSISKHH